MITYTLIGPRRCFCGAVIFHIAKCPMCGERTEGAKAATFLVGALPQSERLSAFTPKQIEQKRLANSWSKKYPYTNAGNAVREIRATRRAGR